MSKLQDILSNENPKKQMQDRQSLTVRGKKGTNRSVQFHNSFYSLDDHHDVVSSW